jgi:hypothetical protein
MPKDKNIVFLDGIINDNARFGKSSEVKEYYTFSLEINAMAIAMSFRDGRTHSQSYVRVFVYDKDQLDYLKRNNVRRGMRVSIMGRLSSYGKEIKGVRFTNLCVVCKDIEIITK